MKTDGKKRKRPVGALVDEKKKSKKKKSKKRKAIEKDETNLGNSQNFTAKSSSTSLMSSIFGGSTSTSEAVDDTNQERASSSLMSSIFDNGGGESTADKASSSTMSLFNNTNIPAAKPRFQPAQELPLKIEPKAEITKISEEESAESIRQTLQNRMYRSQNRPLLTKALDFPGVFSNEEEDEENGFFVLDDENERAKETADAVREHGFCVLRNVMDLDEKQEDSDSDDCNPIRDLVLPQVKDLQRRLNEALTARGIHHSTETFRFKEAASRCRGRTDVVFDAFDRDPEMADAKQKILRNPKFFPVIQNLLGGASSSDDDETTGDVKLVYAGLIFSYPGSCDQPWHQDGEPLFPELPRKQSGVLQASLPPYALNVFLPLEDGDGSVVKGPTEFLPGSHKWKDPDERLNSVTNDDEEDEEKTDDSDSSVASDDEAIRGKKAIIAPVLKQGDALIYDYRVCHRGTANLFGKLEATKDETKKKKKKKARESEKDVAGSRRILYLMYARPWFTDHVNFDYTKSAESLWDDQKSTNTDK